MNVTLPHRAPVEQARASKGGSERRGYLAVVRGYGGVAVHADAHRPLLLRYSAIHSTRGQRLTLRMLALRVVLSHPRVAGPHSGPEIW